MKIAVYNEYWNTRGGGEKHIGAIAEFLSKKYEVDLIATEDVNWILLEERLQIDLSRCSKLLHSNCQDNSLSLLSSKYDLFINSTHESHLYPKSKISAYMCFFPYKINWVSALKRRSILLIKNILLINKKNKNIIIKHGQYEPEDGERIWFSTKADFTVKNSQKIIIFYLFPSFKNNIHEVLINDEPVKWSIKNDKLLIENNKSGNIDIRILSHPLKVNSSDSRKLGFCLKINPKYYNIQYTSNSSTNVVNKYDFIIANSKYTAKWIKKFWGRDSYVIEPLVESNLFKADLTYKKEKIILSVGRFFAGNHNKKHLDMIRAFKVLHDKGILDEEWILVLAGSRHKESRAHIEYYDALKRESLGYPIFIKEDIPFSELAALYQRATIYLHAAGWGEDEKKSPDKFEHFGITTCEAMSSGCIPIVYDAAGQKEIVSNDSVGFRYKNISELTQIFQKVVAMTDSELSKIRAAALHRVMEYDRPRFEEKISDFINKVEALVNEKN
jgi:glycosyltransferase involved in cell wall biosynthesis